VPDRKSKPKRFEIVLLSTMSAFFVSIVIAFLLEYLEKLPQSDRQILQQMKQQLFAIKRVG
jgi:capsular polysaccharide biosynthesis protein